MSKNSKVNSLTEASQPVQAHLGIIRSVIERMASNSALAKSWCITIVSAILVVVAEKEKPDYALLAFIPTILFFALDTYYLAMEKGFKNAYNKFVNKLHSGLLRTDDLYYVKQEGRMSMLQIDAIKSFPVWGFYLVLTIMIGIVRWIMVE